MPSRTIDRPLAVVAVLLALSAGGCRSVWPSNWSVWPKPAEPCVLGDDATKDEIVAHINQRATKLAAWQCSDATISTNQMLASLNAHIAVERPNKFRLVASTTMTGNEADFGSNSERIWFWMSRDPSKKVFTVRHDQLDTVERRLPIPFRPDWLMEALGVIPLNPQNVEMLPRQPGDKMARLISREYTPAGRVVQRTIVVDCCNGNIVSQTLQDMKGRVLMKADFNSFQVERHSGLKLPYRIDVQWPQTDMSMTLRLRTIQVNPAEFAPKTWQLPHYEGCTALDLARGLAARERANRVRRAGHQPRNPGRVRLQPLSHERPEFAEDKGTIQPIPPFRKDAALDGPAASHRSRNAALDGPAAAHPSKDAAGVTPIGGPPATSQAPGRTARPFPGASPGDRPQFSDD
jgi:hypothetical protein